MTLNLCWGYGVNLWIELKLFVSIKGFSDLCILSFDISFEIKLNLESLDWWELIQISGLVGGCCKVKKYYLMMFEMYQRVNGMWLRLKMHYTDYIRFPRTTEYSKANHMHVDGKCCKHLWPCDCFPLTSAWMENTFYSIIYVF